MSIINDIEIKNFKSIRHQKIEGCKRINVFVGPPNVGKSNILEGLGLFSIDFDSKNFSDFVRMGKSTTLFFNGSIENSAQLILNKYYRANAKYKKGQIHISLEEDRSNEGFENLDKWISEGNISITDIKEKLIGNASFNVNEDVNQIENYNGCPSLNVYDKLKKNDLQIGPTKSDILKYEYKKNIQYDSRDASYLRQPYGENIFEIISTKDDLHKSITDILDSYGLNFLYDSELQEYKILKMVGSKFFTVPYFMTADTLRRLIFHKAAVMSNKKSVLLFEEPEANCYEPYIMEITNAIKNDKNENQFFIVTHSQYVIDELMRDEESRNDTNIYLVGLENNETKVKLLSAEASKDAYQTGLNLFFNYQSLWDEN
jgi:AAA15 family ATPase/GTPase